MKVIVTMIKQLVIFLVIWGLIILLYVCVGQLIFYTLIDFGDMRLAATYLIQSALGSWDLSIFLEPRVYVCNPKNPTECYSK